MPEVQQQLEARLSELADLRALAKLVEWDQRTVMPREGASRRAQVLTTLHRLTHDRARAEELGELLGEAALDPPDTTTAELVDVARRDWERARRVPEELAAEIAGAGADGLERWREAREADDFAVFAPALERNLDLARAFAGRFADEIEEPYDALIANFDPGVTTGWLRPVLGTLADELPALIAAAPRPSAVPPPAIPAAVLRSAAAHLLRRLGMDAASWRLDEATHPFSSAIGRRDTRLAIRFTAGGPQGLVLALHEFGHALYERQIAPGLERTPAGRGTSMAVHESQSKVWEDQIGRHPAFAPVLADALRHAGHDVAPGDVYRDLTGVRPSANRIAADPVTYPLHVVLRFELETAMVAGRLAAADVPEAWREGMRRLLGVEPSGDTDGPLQDDHWADGAFGYFPSYAVGSLLAAQLWVALEDDLGPRDEALGSADVGAIAWWLEEHVHRHGRLVDTRDLIRRATGRDLEAGPFLRQAAERAR